MSSSDHAPEPKRFEPKVPVNLNPPKDDPISTEYLAKCDGNSSAYPTYVAIKGKVFDVTGNPAYAPKGAYHAFAGKDASRALALSSLKPEDIRSDWSDLGSTEQGVLNDWMTFFSKRYNIVGVVQPRA
ncbi:putative progesterone binding protein [Xylona heveae TC161]|uniref:Putative progesterone binding protein n=1 Tax=Xylona heveae (strain CBS 132557 / TC161) TaxID=1328760 RepID=A0A165JNA0_XYLHT|nr:putative progesterone binding protein [Xylona heveae TC161]KZF26445.1 putative progesterone binding protein [Xylona heveae TC161]